ncbi:MAG: 2,3-bisphosphoglycerate-independent phosphoglycerate mutase [Candidatus Chisholmbacteria bacterium]|nr:2,3-bisphosphoglycerate-independent phosphoglycerate mutase [Candidatus Chisholmbacteria bacterium]
MTIPQPIVLLILDGWGLATPGPGNAITLAKTPHFNRFWNTYPHTQLIASGEAVGLPAHENGNTETGHLNLGAGHIVYQDLPRINMAIADGSFFQNPTLVTCFNHIRTYSSNLHLLGLVSVGTVHSSLDHLFALLRLAKDQGLKTTYLHLFTDGRDSPPTSAINLIKQIETHCQTLKVGQIASITGRYYAMDRDQRWDRTQAAYETLTQGSVITAPNATQAINQAYSQNHTDEFVPPTTIINSSGQPVSLIQDNDAVIFFNFRIDRPRQLTKAFVLPNFETAAAPTGFDPYAVKYFKTHLPPPTPSQPFTRQKIFTNLFFVTMTEYERGLPVTVAFPPQAVPNPLGRILSDHQKSQLRLTETEKERFVTYYFNGLREDPFPGEDRIIIPSLQVPTYDTKPQMATLELTQTLLQRLVNFNYDFVLVNFPNPDMVAHTGNLKATIIACETVDQSLGQITLNVLGKGGAVIITADHGNAEELINLQTGAVDTEHSNHPVPFILITSDSLTNTQLPQGILADVAPTILKLLQIPPPSTMTGRSLI